MNSEERLLYVIQRLIDEPVSNAVLAQEVFGENTPNNRTKIRNTIKVIQNTFAEKCISTSRGVHKLVDIPKVMRDLYQSSAEGIIEVFEFISLFDTSKLEIFEQSEPELVTKIKKQTQALYHLFDTPFEQIEDTSRWQALKKAIKYRQYISIAYKKNRLKTYNNIKPIRIVYAHQNWYLAALLTEEISAYDLTFFRINNILHVDTMSRTFHPENQAITHLGNMQSLFEQYRAVRYEVQLSVDGAIASYFRRKKYLKTQKILKENSDGSLILSYQITNHQEILPLIKYWAPHIHILSPNSLKKEIEEIYRSYLR